MGSHWFARARSTHANISGVQRNQSRHCHDQFSHITPACPSNSSGLQRAALFPSPMGWRTAWIAISVPRQPLSYSSKPLLILNLIWDGNTASSSPRDVPIPGWGGTPSFWPWMCFWSWEYHQKSHLRAATDNTTRNQSLEGHIAWLDGVFSTSRWAQLKQWSRQSHGGLCKGWVMWNCGR